VQTLPADRLIIVVLFLAVLLALRWYVTRNREVLSKTIAGDRRLTLCEVMPIGGGAKVALVEADGQSFCIVTHGKAAPAVVALNGETRA
jgi:hypothetical protein